MTKNKPFHWLHAALTVALLQGLAAWQPQWILPLFSRPAGWIAAHLAQLPSTWTPETGLHLFTGHGAVLVSGACSGFDFFCLAAAVGMGYLATPRRSLILRWSWVPLSYLLTLFINSGRVLVSISVHAATEQVLGTGFVYTTHLLTGVLCFLPVLILISRLLQPNFDTNILSVDPLPHRQDACVTLTKPNGTPASCQ